MLTNLTQTTELEGQFRALVEMLDRTEHRYGEILREHAYDDLSCFVEYMTPEEPPAAHHEYMCDVYMRIERREALRGAVSMPPGHAKTKFFSRYGPAWYLGRNDRHIYLQGGHSQNFAENEFGRAVRQIIADPKFQSVFPGVDLHPRWQQSGNWYLRNGVGRYVAKGVGQGISGYRGNIGGIDDPFGSKEDADSPAMRMRAKNWLFADFRSRLLPSAPLWIIATRWHEDDLIGYVEKLTAEGKGIPWEIINLNGIIETEAEMATDPLGRSLMEPLWPDFYTIDEIMELKATLPSRDWWALYKGRPRDVEGEAVKSGWFKRFARHPWNRQNEDGSVDRVVRRVTLSVDCALKATQRSNPTAIGVWVEDMKRRHFLVEVKCERLEYPDMEKAINDLALKWGATAVLVEDAGNGTTFVKQNAGRWPHSVIAI
ncbi:MAG: hypothetical protein KJP02_05700, partial [Octadecabacter sp.]|nr:hypothetical protein [Octadecabacter sp.]